MYLVDAMLLSEMNEAARSKNEEKARRPKVAASAPHTLKAQHQLGIGNVP